MTRLSLTTGLLAALAATQAFGQTVVSEANIPFAFEAGKVQFPAGKYKVTQTQNLIQVKQKTGDYKSAFTQGIPLSTRGRPAPYCLRFHVYGNQYFLSEIWADGVGQGLPASKHERLVAQGFKPDPTTNVVAANRLPH